VKLRAALVGLALLAVPSVASAWPQRRDYFLDAPRAGTFVHADVFTVGAQGTFEHRKALEDENMGMLHLRANAMASLGYADLGAHTDLRFGGLFTIGGSVGYRRVWNNYSYPNNIENTRELRHDKTDENVPGGPDRGRVRVNWPWFEARARMVIPLESLWWVNNATWRWESPGNDGADGGMAPNSFDWFHTNVHDPGRLFRFDTTLFYRNKSFGGIGPTLRVMTYKRRGEDVTEIAYGITFGTRPGFRKKDDLFLVQTLVDLSSKEFGWHVGPLEKIPLYAMIIYRMSFQL